MRFNPVERKIGDGSGNGFSQTITAGDAQSGVGSAADLPVFIVDRLVPPRSFPETEWRKEFEVHSKLLSAFYGREVSLKASVILPLNYFTEPNRRFPTIFNVPGFGGTHFPTVYDRQVPESENNEVSFLRVVLDPSCPLGHHVFADSENNGPVGRALLTEFLPAFDRSFRSVADPRARFLMGHSSGGWATLWLQVRYPNEFGGTWSTAPDPVDFSDFQMIDLYRPGQNLYVDQAGHDRPLGAVGRKGCDYDA